MQVVFSEVHVMAEWLRSQMNETKMLSELLLHRFH